MRLVRLELVAIDPDRLRALEIERRLGRTRPTSTHLKPGSRKHAVKSPPEVAPLSREARLHRGDSTHVVRQMSRSRGRVMKLSFVDY
jgi:hypothetical protein